MDELLDSMYARAIAKFKESDTGNLLGATNLTIKWHANTTLLIGGVILLSLRH